MIGNLVELNSERLKVSANTRENNFIGNVAINKLSEEEEISRKISVRKRQIEKKCIRENKQ